MLFRFLVLEKWPSAHLFLEVSSTRLDTNSIFSSEWRDDTDFDCFITFQECLKDITNTKQSDVHTQLSQGQAQEGGLDFKDFLWVRVCQFSHFQIGLMSN